MGDWLTGDDLRTLASLPSGTTIAIALQWLDDDSRAAHVLSKRGTPLEPYVGGLLEDPGEQHTENDDVRLWLAEHPVCGLKARVLTPEEAEASQNPFGPEYEIAALQSRVATLEVKVATQEAEIARANRNLDRWRGRAKRAEAELTALKARFVQHQNTWNTLLGEYIERERNLTR